MECNGHLPMLCGDDLIHCLVAFNTLNSLDNCIDAIVSCDVLKLENEQGNDLVNIGKQLLKCLRFKKKKDHVTVSLMDLVARLELGCWRITQVGGCIDECTAGWLQLWKWVVGGE